MQMDATPYSDVNVILDLLLSSIQRILGPKLVGFYLYGSLVVGDFDHESSDIDLLATTSFDLDEEEFDALQQMHHDLAHNYQDWDDRIEVAYLSVAALKTYRSQASKIAIISPGEPFHIKDAGSDWLINWYLVREKGKTLFGPSPVTLIDPISRAEFLHAVREQAIAWREWIRHTRLRREQAYAILTMCRALYTLKLEEYPSKKQAALWAQKELPEWSSLIQQALTWRMAWRDVEIDHEATLPQTLWFVHFVLSLCEGTPRTSTDGI